MFPMPWWELWPRIPMRRQRKSTSGQRETRISDQKLLLFKRVVTVHMSRVNHNIIKRGRFREDVCPIGSVCLDHRAVRWLKEHQ